MYTYMKRDEYILEGKVRVGTSGIYFVSNSKVFKIGGVCFDREEEELYWMCILDEPIGRDMGI